VFINADDVKNMESRYGPAKRISFDPIPMQDFEYQLLVGSMASGRKHDVTMFVELDGGYVGIQKPSYANTGIFRAPSGGLNPGETIEQGLKREILEETGLEVKIDKLLLIVNTSFVGPDGDSREWTSFVFSGYAEKGGVPAPIDTHEISDIRIVTREEMLGPIAEKMERSGMGGFYYRVNLTRETFRAIDERAKAAD
jgi:ADP-ribose pyrophosphatase YjhB (NUDIX family)